MRRLWLLLVVAITGIGLFVAHLLGAAAHHLEVATTMISAVVIACSFVERLRLAQRDRARRSALRRPAPIFGQGQRSRRLPTAHGAGGLRSLR